MRKRLTRSSFAFLFAAVGTLAVGYLASSVIGSEDQQGSQTTIKPVHQEMLARLASRSDVRPANDTPLALCWADGTDPNLIETFKTTYSGPDNLSLAPSDLPAGPSPVFQFPDANRWSTTATDGGGLTQGQPTTLTWSIAPDGTVIPGFVGEPTTVSNLIAFLDGIYGAAPGPLSNRPWFPIVQSIYDRWSALTGVNYVYEPNDDGVAFSANSNVAPGVIGTRGDARVGGHFIDGNSGILGYNFFPNNGEMVLDTGDNFYTNTTNSSIRLRNVMAHEAGHGLGFEHVCPINVTKLMEPFYTGSFDGPQFDDILGGNRGYGDPNEFPVENDTAANATSVGAMGFGDTEFRDGVSVDDNVDRDYYGFTVPGGAEASVTVTPVGFTYLSGPQCVAGSPFDALRQSDLGVDLVSTDGSTVISSANAGGLGDPETLSNVVLMDGAGTYYVRVWGTANRAQMYEVTINVDAAVVPVTMASLSAARRGADVRVAWAISGPSVDHVQFHVHRETTEGGTTQLTQASLRGQRLYEFTDTAAPFGEAQYWIEEIDAAGDRYWHGPLAVGEGIAMKLGVSAYPNPFNPTTTIRYSVPSAGPVTVAIFDVSGRLVETLVDNEYRDTNAYELLYEAPTATGIYFVRVSAGRSAVTQKLVLLK